MCVYVCVYIYLSLYICIYTHTYILFGGGGVEANLGLLYTEHKLYLSYTGHTFNRLCLCCVEKHPDL